MHGVAGELAKRFPAYWTVVVDDVRVDDIDVSLVRGPPLERFPAAASVVLGVAVGIRQSVPVVVVTDYPIEIAAVRTRVPLFNLVSETEINADKREF